MRYHVLACDYDGTIAQHGRVDDATIAALGRLRDTGRRAILVTGRELQDLLAVCPRVDLFDRVVAENGALVYCPATRQEHLLGEPPPERFVRALRERGVSPVGVGRVIVATWKPHETTVLEVIRDLGLELHVTFNKDAVMVLPAGMSKATGLAEALRELGLSADNVVGVGDGENDHAFLHLCECRIAVANAVPMLKDGADSAGATPSCWATASIVRRSAAAFRHKCPPCRLVGERQVHSGHGRSRAPRRARIPVLRDRSGGGLFRARGGDRARRFTA
jgi:hydroxymethylpyrimidine pyrophosphatase-like HAD family hydrolase